MTTNLVSWNEDRKGTGGYTYFDSKCGGYQISKTPGKRSTSNTVLFADGTRGTTEKQYFSLFIRTPGNCDQSGNYRTLAEAQAAANAHATK